MVGGMQFSVQINGLTKVWIETLPRGLRHIASKARDPDELYSYRENRVKARSDTGLKWVGGTLGQFEQPNTQV